MSTTIIAAEEVATHTGDTGWVLVDCRHALADPEHGRQLYATGHLPGAVHAHLDEDLASPVTSRTGRHPLPDVAGFTQKLGQWGIGSGTQVVVYDDVGGAMAARLWWLLKWLGHDAVAVLDGGYGAWRAAGYPLDRTPPSPGPAIFTGTPESARTIETSELQTALGAGLLLVDVRDGERFRGDAEPLDTVAGHIPGARNHPFKDNLDADARLLPAATLRQHFETALGGVAPEQAVLMCGSGVTACHSLLAMEIAGLSGARLYAGSWSEWIRDPDRPVATGPA